jgi:hypothetical protein
MTISSNLPRSLTAASVRDSQRRADFALDRINNNCGRLATFRQAQCRSECVSASSAHRHWRSALTLPQDTSQLLDSVAEKMLWARLQSNE